MKRKCKHHHQEERKTNLIDEKLCQSFSIAAMCITKVKILK